MTTSTSLTVTSSYGLQSQAVADRFRAFEQQISDERAGRRPRSPLALPGVGPWGPGVSCQACGAPAQRRRCAPCSTAVKLVLRRLRVPRLSFLPTLQRGRCRPPGSTA
jgi:hypothetical protein